MIRVTSASDNKDFFINHRKIQIIKQSGQNLYIVLDTGKSLIVSSSIDDIRNRIIEFENSVICPNKITNKEVVDSNE